MSAIGIDWGAHSSVVAKKRAGGSIDVCVNDQSNRATPTMLGFEHNQMLYGEICGSRIISISKNCFTSLVQAVGSTTAPKNDLWTAVDGSMSITMGNEDMSVDITTVVGLLLRKLHSTSLEQSDEATQVAIAIPDWYSQAQIDEMDRAIKIVEIPNMEKIVFYKHSDALVAQYERCTTKGDVMIIDVGLTHTTVTRGTFSEDAPTANVESETIRLGTDFLINGLVDLCVQHTKTKYGKDVEIRSTYGHKLRTVCEKALIQLSMGPKADIQLEYWLKDEIDFDMSITREKLADKVKDQLKEIEDLITKMRRDTKFAKIEIMGGGGRCTLLKERIGKIFNVDIKDLGKSLDGSSAVAIGAIAALLKENQECEVKATEMSEDDISALEPSQAKRRRLIEIHDEETRRQEAKYALESFLFECNGWVTGPEKADINVESFGPYLEEVQEWLYTTEDEPQNFKTEDFENKLTELRERMAVDAKGLMDKKEAVKQKLEAELAELQKETDAKEKDDHDQRKLPNEERLRLAEKQRLEGNDKFKAGAYVDAVSRYGKARSHLEKMFDINPDQKEQQQKLYLSCFLNTAQCYLKATEKETVGSPNEEQLLKKVKTSCDSALDIEAENVKALFRRATALERLKKIEDADKDIQILLKIEPENAQFLNMDKRVKRAIEIAKQKEQKMYGKMFG